MKRKIIVAMVVIVGLSVGLYFMFRPETKNQTPNEQKQYIVKLDNAEEFSPEIDDGLTKVEQTLYGRVRSYTVSPLAIYHGKVRSDSFKTTYTHYEAVSPAIDVPTLKYIVDIPAIKQSYLVSKSGGKDYPYNILYVVCVPKEKMIYADFGCKDEF